MTLGIFRRLGKAAETAKKGAAEGKAQGIRDTNEQLLALLGKLGIQASSTGNPRADIPMNWALLLVWMTSDRFQGWRGQIPHPKEELIIALGVVDFISEILCDISGHEKDFRAILTATAANILFFNTPPDYRIVAEAAKKQHKDFYAKGHDKAMDNLVVGAQDIFKKQDLDSRSKITSAIDVFMTKAAPISYAELSSMFSQAGAE